MDGGSLKTRFSGSGPSSTSGGVGGKANGGAGSGGVNLRMGHIYLVMEYVDHDLAGLIDAKVRPPPFLPLSLPPSLLSSSFQLPQSSALNPIPPLPLSLFFSLSPPFQIPLTEARIKCLVKQILDGLNHMHERELVHRDLKCSNILVSNLHDLKLADFGLARSLDFSQHDREEMPHLTTKVVTLWYRAPELLYGNPNYDTAVDMWSLGCIIVELIQGRPLFPATSEVELLGMIYGLLGTPRQEAFARMKAPGSSLECPDYKPSQFDAKYRHVLGSAFDLVQRLLVLDPRQRLTARGALNNLYFLDDATGGAIADPHLLPKLAGDHQSYHEFETKKVKREKKQQLQAEAAAAEAVKRGDMLQATAILAGAHRSSTSSTSTGGSSGTYAYPHSQPPPPPTHSPDEDQDMDISDGDDEHFSNQSRRPPSPPPPPPPPSEKGREREKGVRQQTSSREEGMQGEGRSSSWRRNRSDRDRSEERMERGKEESGEGGHRKRRRESEGGGG